MRWWKQKTRTFLESKTNVFVFFVVVCVKAATATSVANNTDYNPYILHQVTRTESGQADVVVVSSAKSRNKYLIQWRKGNYYFTRFFHWISRHTFGVLKWLRVTTIIVCECDVLCVRFRRQRERFAPTTFSHATANVSDSVRRRYHATLNGAPVKNVSLGAKRSERSTAHVAKCVLCEANTANTNNWVKRRRNGTQQKLLLLSVFGVNYL